MEYLIFSGAFMLVMFSIIWLISYISSFKEPCPLPNGVYEPEFIVADPYALSAVALSPQGFAPAHAHPSIFELSQAELMHRCTDAPPGTAKLYTPPNIFSCYENGHR